MTSRPTKKPSPRVEAKARAPKAARHLTEKAKPPAHTETQRRLLDAALHLFAEKGFDGVSTAQIAARARVAEKTLFANFGSKERLYRATIEPARLLAIIMPEAVRSLAPVFQEAPDDLRALLRSLLRNRVAFARAHRREIKLLLQHLVRRPEDGTERLVGLWSEHMAPLIHPLVQRLVARGALRDDVSPSAIMRLVASSAVGYVLPSVVLRPDLELDDEREIEQIVSLVVDGLSPREKPGGGKEKR